MAAANILSKCSECEEINETYICTGCSQTFCFKHLQDHRQNINQQFNTIEDEYNSYRQDIKDENNQIKNYPLLQQINQWKEESIKKIQQKAKQCEERLINLSINYYIQLEYYLNQFNDHFKGFRDKMQLNEFNLNQLKDKLNKLKQQLDQPLIISIEQEKSTSFINEIFVKCEQQLFIPNLNINQTWIQNGITQAGGHGYGKQLNKLFHPTGVYLDDDQTIYVADYDNHRIVEWKNGAINGQIVAGGYESGDRNDQLNRPQNMIIDKENDCFIICDQGNRRVVRWPRRNGQSGKTIISNIDCLDLIMHNDGYLYVSDIEKDEVRRWKMGETEGTIVAGGNGKGNRLDQLDCPFYIFVDEDRSVYVSDWNNHRVMKWLKDAKEGIIVAGGQSEGNGLKQLSYPCGIIVDQLGSIYVADQSNDRVMRWLKGAEEGTIVVGGNGEGEKPNQFVSPVDLSFDQQNNLYVVDRDNNRVQKFDVNMN